MPRYKLRTLLILMAVLPPTLAGVCFRPMLTHVLVDFRLKIVEPAGVCRASELINNQLARAAA
jgi:hypothetical protein